MALAGSAWLARSISREGEEAAKPNPEENPKPASVAMCRDDKKAAWVTSYHRHWQHVLLNIVVGVADAAPWRAGHIQIARSRRNPRHHTDQAVQSEQTGMKYKAARNFAQRFANQDDDDNKRGVRPQISRMIGWKNSVDSHQKVTTLLSHPPRDPQLRGIGW